MINLTKYLLAASGGSGEPEAEWQVIGSAFGTGTVNFPVGYQAGDYVLAIASPGITTPEDYVLLATGGISTVHLLKGISNQTSLAFGTGKAGAIVILRPVNVPPTILANDVFYQKAYAVSIDPPSVTTTTNNNIIFALGATRSGQQFSAGPSGYTSIGSFYDAYDGHSVAIAYKVQTTAGLEDPSTFTILSGNDSRDTFTLSLRREFIPGFVSFSSNFMDEVVDLGGQVVTSNAVTVTSEDGSSKSISISGGNSSDYRINGGAWTSASGTINSGDTLEVRQTSVTGTNGTITASVATLTIGAVATTYRLNTRRELVLIGSSTSNTDTVVNWTVPVGVSSVSITGTGAGGPAGSPLTQSSGGVQTLQVSGGGGGGGAMARVPSQSVSSGQTLVVTAGGVQNGFSGLAGRDSSVVRSGVTLMLAKGGNFGTNATSSAGGSGGAGGSATNSIGTTRHAGGNGGSGARNQSSTFLQTIYGGGGGAGGYTGAGGRGSNGVTSGTPASVAGTGGAASGGSNGGGGGGTGVSGAGTSGGSVTGNNGGQEGSPDVNATAGAWSSSGRSGGGGGARFTMQSGPGIVRVTW
jgi:hypothetical protein